MEAPHLDAPAPELDAPPADARLEVLCQLTAAVGRAAGLPQIYDAALNALERALAPDHAAILLADPDGVVRFKAWRRLSDEYRAAVEGHFPWRLDDPAPEPVLVPDAHDDPELDGLRPVLDGEGVRALGFVPLVSRDRLLGKFMVYYDAPHAFTADEILFARAIASHVAFAVDRRRAEEQLQLYREIFAHSTEAIATVDVQGRYLEQNAAHRALTGFDDADLAGNTPAIHLGEAGFARVAAALAEHGVFNGEMSSTGRDGARRELDLAAFAVRDESGAPVCFVGIKRDISERKLAEQALQFLAGASATLDRSLDWDATLRELAELMVPTLADWAIVDLASPDSLLRPPMAVHVDPAAGAALAEHLRRVPPGRASTFAASSAIADGRLRRIDAGEAWLAREIAGADPALLALGARDAVVVPLKARHRMLGALTLVRATRPHTARELALAVDLAHRGAYALDNARLYREAQESDRRKEHFLAVLAHELRNPLAPLLVSMELLRLDEHRDGERLDRIRGVMERQIRNLTRLVDDLLDVSRITRGKIVLHRQTVDLAAVVANAVETVRPAAQARGLDLAVDTTPGLWVAGDALRLEQVLTNLLHNAVKYTAPRGRVRVEASEESDEAVVHVADDGAGIPAELLPHVFDLFVQGETAPGRAPGGLGVGLTLVRTLVELHDGSVVAASAGAGRGSTFTVRLPRAARPPAPGRIDGPPIPGAAPRRALIVDDNVDAATGLGELLRLRGHEVAIAHDGGTALAQAARVPPEVVLLDIGLPDMDGYELARRLRELPGLAGVRLIAVSGFGQEQHLERSRALRFEAHLVKPVDLARLESLMTH